MNKLTPKQDKFCHKVVELGSISDAYRAAYNSSRMKGDTINNKAYILSNKGDIRARIEELQKKAEKRNEVTVDRIIQELKLISFFDPRTLYNDTGKMLEVHKLPEDVARAISEIRVTEMKVGPNVTKTNTTLKLYSKLDAIEKIAKHLGFYERDNEQKGKSAADFFLEVMKEASGGKQ